jgi:hypothetical protein
VHGYDLLQKISVLEGCHSALQSIYEEQQALQTGTAKKLSHHLLYSKEYNRIKNNLCEKGKRPTGTQDPQDGTAEDTLTADQMLALAHLFMCKGTAEGDRNLAMALWSYATVMRGDDVRLLYLCDILKPVKLTCVGESLKVPCIVYIVLAVSS